MIKLAIRNLFHDPTRLFISAGGVALAVMLILIMAGVFAGSEEHAVAYIKNQPAPLWLMQVGVENLHMSSSILPSDAVRRARQVDGVAEAVGLLYASGGVDLGEETVYSYIFAVQNGAPFGGPWDLVEGTADLERDEVIIDRDLASRYGLGLGDTVNIFGLDLFIAGLSEETFGIATSITFVNKDALALLMGASPEAASYILIKPAPGAELEELADRLREAVPEANLLTQSAFIASDREMIRQMGADIIQAMNYVAYVVGLLVIGLTIYTATLERKREYGVLKAIGADTPTLLRAVFAQALIGSGLGFLLGVALAYGVAALVGQLFPEMLVLIEPAYVIQQVPVFILVTALAALLPIERIARMDPMVVFKA
jgi:putative ABC transport system permease protein